MEGNVLVEVRPERLDHAQVEHPQSFVDLDKQSFEVQLFKDELLVETFVEVAHSCEDAEHFLDHFEED